MKLDKIYPCTCIKYQLDSSVDPEYGMPLLRVSSGQWYRAYCPRCGRGDTLSNFKSPYLALKNWNEIMEHAWKQPADISGLLVGGTDKLLHDYNALPKLTDGNGWRFDEPQKSINEELEEWH